MALKEGQIVGEKNEQEETTSSNEETTSEELTTVDHEFTTEKPTAKVPPVTTMNALASTKGQQEKAKNVVKKPKPAKIKKIKRAKKSLKITWKKIKGVKGYQIQYSTSSKFKKAKKITIKKAKTTSRTIKKLKAKKRYYVRIRTYIIVKGKKKYSNWSKKKSQETK